MSQQEKKGSGAIEKDEPVGQQRTEEFRRAAVEKLHSPGARAVEKITGDVRLRTIGPIYGRE